MLKQHMKLVHSKVTAIKCNWPECDAVLKTKESYRIHLALVHQQGNKFTCSDCGKGFPFKSLYEKHLNKHKEKTPRNKKEKTLVEAITGHNYYQLNNNLECPFQTCQYKFTNTYLLRRHLEGRLHADEVHQLEVDTFKLKSIG